MTHKQINEILVKLNLADVRSIQQIINNPVLCNRILSEDVMDIKKYAKTSAIAIGAIRRLAKLEIISSFSNKKWAKGAKTFIFPEELKEYDTPLFKSGTLYSEMKKIVQIYVTLHPNLTTKERRALVSLGRPDVKKDIYQLTKGYKKILLDVQDLNKLYDDFIETSAIVKQLTPQYKPMPMPIPIVSKSINLLSHPSVLDFSPRVLKTFNKAAINTIQEILDYDLESLLKFRNFGVNSLHQIYETLKRNNILKI